MRLAPAKVEVEKRRDGSMLLRSPQKLAPYARCVTEWLVKWSDAEPDRTFLAERKGDGWRNEARAIAGERSATVKPMARCGESRRRCSSAG